MAESSRTDNSTFDPLGCLGPSLFLQILSNLPYTSIIKAESVSRSWRNLIQSRSKTVWRTACRLTDIEPKHLNQLLSLERTFSSAGASAWYGEPGEEEPLPPDEPTGSIDWKAIIESNTLLSQNWKHGRCRERYACPPGNVVWRFKVDNEQDTMLCTDRTGGLAVIDNKTSAPLFTIPDVRPYAHIEFARGLAVFDIAHDRAFEVWRTQPAITRSDHKTVRSISTLTMFPTSHTHASFNAKTDPLPRGHLRFYRKITPPTLCNAFRARVDHEDIEGKERAVLATAGPEAIYIWDLDEEGKVETVKVDIDDGERISYVEFDEGYIFLCTTSPVYIYSRVTRQLVMTIFTHELVGEPERSCISEPYRSAPTYAFDRDKPSVLCPRLPVGQPVGGLADGIPEYQEAWMRDCDFQYRSGGIDGAVEHYTACHYTSTDLYLATNTSHVVIIRDYRTAFSAPEAERAQAVANRLIFLHCGGEPVELLSTYRNHVAFATKDTIFILDPTSLPSLPRNPSSCIAQFIRAKCIVSTLTQATSMAACLQLDRANLYLTYWALGEFNTGGLVDPYRAMEGEVVRRLPPEEATDEFGMCVKVWEYTPWDAGV